MLRFILSSIALIAYGKGRTKNNYQSMAKKPAPNMYLRQSCSLVGLAIDIEFGYSILGGNGAFYAIHGIQEDHGWVAQLSVE